MLKIIKTSEGKTNFIIFMIGLVCTLVGIIANKKLGEQVSTVTVSVGASIMASAIVSYITAIYLFKKQKQRELTEVWGLNQITETRTEMNFVLRENFENLSENLDIIGYGLKSLRESEQENLLRDKLKTGVSIRIITVDPKSPLLKNKDFDENKPEGSTADSIIKLNKWIEQLQSETQGNISIKFCKTLPTEMYYRIDSKIYVGPYEIGRESQKTITLEFNGETRGFNYYSRYFEKLWNDKNFCQDSIDWIDSDDS